MSQQLALKGVQVSSGGLRRVWGRYKLPTRHERLLRLEKTTREKSFELSDGNGFVERLHRPLLDEYFRIGARLGMSSRADAEGTWMAICITTTASARTRPKMSGRVPYQAFIDELPKSGTKSKKSSKEAA